MNISTRYELLWTLLLLSFICCIICDCPFPTKGLENGRFLYQKKKDANKTVAPENYLLRFKCNVGYTAVGSKAIICSRDQWSGDIPHCTELECTEPPEVLNAFYDLKSGVENTPILGSQASYVCKPGYEFVNESATTVHCALDHGANKGRWAGEMPLCKAKVSCQDPGVSPDGKREGSCCLTGAIVNYTCNDDFELVGSQQIECLLWGNWSASRPLCRPPSDFCDLPPTVLHGIAVGNKIGDYYALYDEIEIMCEPGYSYRGPTEFLECEENGEWEDEFGECQETICDLPKPLGNGTILELESSNATQFTYDFQLTYVCDKGFRLIGNSWRFCGHRGWTGTEPYCELIRCPDPGTPEQGARDGDSFDIGAKVFYKCFAGYHLLGSFESYCRPNGQWSGEVARCNLDRNYCPNPGIPINGAKNGSNYDMGSVIGFRCKQGYILIGSESRECLYNRTWSGDETACKGKYDFDDTYRVRDSLQRTLAEKAAEQEKYLKDYKTAVAESFMGQGPIGRTIDLSYSGRLVFYFAFDVSGSIGEDNFRKSVEFAKALVRRVGISDIGTRAGALTFSSKAEVLFLPVLYSTVEEVLDALDRIEFSGGGTAASSAFNIIREEMIPLTQEVLGIKGQKSIVFVMTDGKANMGGDPLDEAKTLKDGGVEIYCIGITGDDYQDSLFKLASDKKEDHVFILQSYNSLAWLIQEITNGTADYSKCGLGLENAGIHNRGRITGGNKAADPWPWMAALFFKANGAINPAESELQCGGSVINQHFVMSAAHCMYTNSWKERKKEDLIIKLGLTNVANETYLQEYEVTKIYFPEQFKIRHYDYDIVLLKLKAPIEFNPFVRPICLPPRDLPAGTTLYHPDQFALAIGWGHDGIIFNSRNNIPTKTVEHLKEIILPIQSNLRCKQSLVGRADPSVFTERMFCAGDDHAGNDTCKGDSGGPLMQSQMNEDGYLYWTQVGIVSWGLGCGVPNTYGFYSHVQKLRDWIDETLTKDSLEED